MKLQPISVIGDGPAALCSAIFLAGQGLPVLLFRQGNPSGVHNCYGETLPGNILLELGVLGLGKLPVTAGLAAVQNSISYWGGEEAGTRSRIIDLAGLGWIMQRKPVLALLEARAVESGVIIRNDAVLDIREEWSGVAITVSDKSLLYSSFVILATGRKAPGYCSLPRKWCVDRLVACMLSVKIEPGQSDRDIRVAATECGWLFSVCPNVHTRVISYFTDGDLLPPRVKQDPAGFIRGAARGVASIIPDPANYPTYSTGIVSANTYYRRRCCSGRLFVCGDLAQTVDPLSSQGISNAVHDGVAIGKAILARLNGNLAAFAIHESDRSKRFIDYLHTRHNVYSMVQQWPASPFWKRRHAVSTLGG